MSDMTFTEADLKRIEAEGLTLEKVLAQLERFRRGSFPARLNRPCTLNDGILVLGEHEKAECAAAYDQAAREGRIMKFVPASGAASRMFQDWCRIYQAGGFSDPETSGRFAADVRRFAFLDDLRERLGQEGLDLDRLLAAARTMDILGAILTPRGLNYAWLPKALLKFHTYPERNRTSLEEHLVEAVLYTRDAKNVCRIHFTVSKEHEALVQEYLSQVRGYYEDRYQAAFQIGISTQHSSTNTVAADLENRPFHDKEGALVFRPGGHGALLENFNALDGDIVMVKNIDNVVPDRLKETTVLYKKILGGCLILLQREGFRYLELLSKGIPDEALASQAARFCRNKFSAVWPAGFDACSIGEKRDVLIERLNRPIRVCGMVKNEGEPGGGPFWVDEEDGTRSLQIIEENQIDAHSEDQKRKWKSATHFNPVDLACGIRDFRSRKFDLRGFVDEKTYLISKKSQEGMDMKALEHPGLWNGSMARWNTVFIEVPIETFNPVKAVYDLLRKQHLPD